MRLAAAGLFALGVLITTLSAKAEANLIYE
jgi:hypothetical protein